MSDEIEDVDLDDLEKRMTGALNAVKHDFSSLRTGRASASMLDAVMVDAYGSATPINQVATINVPEPRMVSVNVWDKTMVAAVDKAIRQSGLGLNPVMDGTTLRLPIPELNEERRRELSKLAGQYAENARISVRNVRKDGMDHLKKAKENISEDDHKIWADEIQELTDKVIANIDTALDSKQTEIMQV
ncbi:MAG: ribosome recycling factor [Paracoccaceae bacterium]